MSIPHASEILRDVRINLVFFSRLPVPRGDLDGARLAGAIWAAPVAGWAVALAGAAAFAIAHALGLDAAPAAALAIAATMLVTGGLHEDGLSDTADGFGGGRTRERALEIMRDSRIGSFGAATLVLSILLRWTALAEFSSPPAVLAALIAAHGASRALLPSFMRLLPNARTDGLSAGTGGVDTTTANVALALGFLSLLTLGLGHAIFAVILLAGLFFAFRWLCMEKIGGQTGDTVGSLQQLAEILVLLIASAVL
jgi:adenosylcobinamide-GDP ribazoletransferase